LHKPSREALFFADFATCLYTFPTYWPVMQIASRLVLWVLKHCITP